MSVNRSIEVEVRAIFDESKYTTLSNFLSQNAEDLGEDDKDVYFFLLPTKVIKVVNNISKGTAKIVAKLTRVGQGENDTEEIEIFIDPKDFDSTVKLFKELPFTEVQRSFQKRHNYMYKGVEIALKYSESWGYHIELEIMIVSKDDLIEAETKLKSVAEELGVNIMSPEEQKVFADNIDIQYKKNIKVQG